MKETHNLNVYDTLVSVEEEQRRSPMPTISSRKNAAPTIKLSSSRVSEAPNSSRRQETETSSTTAEDPDLAVFVQDLLEQMETRFSILEKSITGKMENMGEKMDELDGAIAGLMDQAGLEQPQDSDNVASAAKTSPKFDIPASNSLADRSSESRAVL